MSKLNFLSASELKALKVVGGGNYSCRPKPSCNPGPSPSPRQRSGPIYRGLVWL